MSGKRYLLVLGALGLVIYLIIFDLGVSAGRIHHGVHVASLDLGGLTEAEAAEALGRRAGEMRDMPIVFWLPGMSVSLLPREVSWRPRVTDTASAALRVGRDGAPFGALADRFRGWFEGVRLDWAGHARPREVSRFIDRVERQVRQAGSELDRARFRYKIKRGLRLWPRKALRIPVDDG